MYLNEHLHATSKNEMQKRISEGEFEFQFVTSSGFLSNEPTKQLLAAKFRHFLFVICPRWLRVYVVMALDVNVCSVEEKTMT